MVSDPRSCLSTTTRKQSITQSIISTRSINMKFSILAQNILAISGFAKWQRSMNPANENKLKRLQY